MNIEDVARRPGPPAKTIRYYEEIGLITPLRSANGYRTFRDSDLHKLAFLGHASAGVKRVASDHLKRIDATLADLVSCCAGDDRSDCPILADLATGPET